MEALFDSDDQMLSATVDKGCRLGCEYKELEAFVGKNPR